MLASIQENPQKLVAHISLKMTCFLMLMLGALLPLAYAHASPSVQKQPDATNTANSPSPSNAQPYQQTSPVTEGLQLAVSFKGVTTPAGANFDYASPIFLDVSLENTTDKPITLLAPVPNIAPRMNLIVLPLNNANPMPLTAYGKANYVIPDFNAPYVPTDNQPTVKEYIRDVPAHGALHWHFLLNRFFDFSEEGDYEVFAKQLIPTLDHKGRVIIQSRPLVFFVGNGREVDQAPDYLSNPSYP